MQTTETSIGPSTVQPIAADSFLALIQTHESAPPPTVTALATQIEERADEQIRLRDAANEHTRQMVEMFLAISEILNLLHERIVAENRQPAEIPVDISGALAPMAQSLNLALDEICDRIEATERRQIQTIEAALKQWESERECESAEKALETEAFQLQAQIEVNRLLRVMWLGTGLAAIGAGIALAILS